MAYCKNTKKQQKGFTAIEIIAVILIIAIVGVVAISRMTSTKTYNVAAEVEILKANLRYAQFRALSDADTAYGANNVTWGIKINGNSSYTLQRNGADATTYFPSDNSPTHTMPSGINISGSDVTFDVWGIPVLNGEPLDEDSTITITEGATSQTITVTKNTGFIP